MARRIIFLRNRNSSLCQHHPKENPQLPFHQHRDWIWPQSIQSFHATASHNSVICLRIRTDTSHMWRITSDFLSQEKYHFIWGSNVLSPRIPYMSWLVRPNSYLVFLWRYCSRLPWTWPLTCKRKSPGLQMGRGCILRRENPFYTCSFCSLGTV